jgi:hypothetical protein
MGASSLRRGTDFASIDGIRFSILADAGELVTSWKSASARPLIRCANFKEAARPSESMAMKQITVLHRNCVAGCLARADYDLDIATAKDWELILEAVRSATSMRAIVAFRSRM